MAAANEKATASVTKKISLGNGTYMYLGTIALGSEYATGGNEVVTATGERYSLPEKIDYMNIEPNGGYLFEFTAGKVKAYVGPAAAKEPSQQVAAAKDLSAVKAAAFVCIGA